MGEAGKGNEQEREKPLQTVRKKLIVLSGKGGVGKSTVSVNLAVALGLKGFKVGLLDIDIHGPNIPKMLGLDGIRPPIVENRMYPVGYADKIKVMSMGFLLPDESQAVAWRGPLKHKMIQEFLYNVEWGELDVLVIDSPPGTGDEILSIYALLEDTLNGAVIVGTPQKVALSDVKKSITFCKHTGIPIVGVIENMSGLVCPKCGEVIDVFQSGGAEKMAEEMGVPFLGKIPMDPTVSRGGDAGKPVVLENPDSKPAQAFFDIVEKIKQTLGL